MVRPPGKLARCRIFKRHTAKNQQSMPPRHSCRSRTIYPAELQPHILGPAVLREQQILYHDLRRIARRGGIFFADPVLRGRLPAMRIHGGAGAGVRRSVGKIPAVWSGGSALRPCGLAIRRCGRTFVGLNPADTPSAGAPGGRSVWGLPGGCLVRRFCPAAMGGSSALRPGLYSGRRRRWRRWPAQCPLPQPRIPRAARRGCPPFPLCSR